MNTAPLRTRKTALALAALLALGLARSPDAQAAACTFNPASGNWNVAANWSCGSIPGAGDNATVGASSTVTIPGGFAAGTASLNNAGTVGVSNNSTLTLRGSNQNAGSIQLNSVGNLTDLAISGATSLNGSGGIDTTNWFSNRIVSASNNASDVLTLGAGQFVRGAGQIGAGGPLGLVNNGSLIANQSAGMTLSTSGSVTNNNIIRGDGAVFTISATTVNQGAAGVLDAINGGSVTLTGGSKIIGGTFTSDSGSAVSVASGHNARLSGVTNSGNLTLANSASLYLDGTLTNNGSLNLNSVGNNTDLITSGNQLIDGSGTITLSNRSSNRIRAATAGDRLTLGANQTLQGSGEIGAGSGLIFDNTGTVIATQSAPLLINAASVNNTGTLRADGGTLQLQTTINSAGGQIEARNGSRVELLSGTIINDAAFSATGAGSLITTVGGATVTLGGGTVNGPMSVANNSVLRLSGDLSYNGALTLNSVGNNTDLQIDGARALGGNLSIGTSNWAANRILARNASGDVLTLGGSVTMQGAGQIGAGGSLGLVNNGSLIANQSAGMTLSTNGSVTNNNIIRGDGRTFTIDATTVNQGAAGVLDAINGGSVALTGGSKIIGGTFTSDSGSAVSVASSHNARLSGVTNSGNLTLANSASLYLDGTLTNNGSLNLNSVGNNTDLITSGNQLIDGSGTITLSNRSSNRIRAAAAGDRLTLGAGQTLQGSGQIGAGSGLIFDNTGTVIATQSAPLLINAASVNNTGTLRADGGTLQLQTTINSAGGQIEARNGSRVELLTGAIINNAAFSATGAGSLITTVGGATVTLGGGTVNGPMSVANNSVLRLSGDLSYNGALTLNSVGNNTDLQIDGARALGGNLSIGTSNWAANRILARNASGDVLTLGGSVTMQGAGQIGAGGSLGLVNNGSLIANQSAGMTLSTSGSVTNNNIIRGDGRTFTIDATTVNQGAAGVLDAINGGSVALTGGSKIIGGTFTSDSGSAVSVASGHNARLSGVTNSGNLTLANSASLYLDGTLTNNGSLNLNSVGNNTDLITSGNQLIDGSGTITLSNRSSNRIRAANAAGDRLTLGVNQVLQGAGQIGAGSALDLVNRGTINANQSTALTISVNAANSVRNEAGGLMQASSSLSTLNLVNVVQNDGTIAANSGNVNASAGFNGSGTARTTGTGVLTVGADSTVGILINDGSAANALTLGTKNITVSVDYTNANAGSGNAFNRRANVSGTGQILAGGDVSQVITGANVSNGNTANATLTIGNVRVGATTFDYQIGNAGSTGPTLRGAIQTSVNGGNLTDARLSGAGVTAGNYNADGPGGSSTNLGVTFTAASAGVLAPLSGQVLNLRSNFDNIADQKLNIVLASGAAAYNAATGSASPSPTVNLGSARVGGTLAQTFTVTNTAPAGAYTEDLNASFIAASGAVSHNGGVISALVAGGSNSSAMSASLDTASAGAKTGSVTIDYQTAGTVGNVSNGLAAASAGTQTITLNGAVYNMAVGSATPGPVSIANQRVGGSNTVALTVGNTAAAGNYSEDLRASFGSSTGAATNNGGVINALLAGGSDGSAMRVGVDTGTAGAKSGTVTLNYQTTGTVNGVSNGLGLTGVGNQVINVSGNVYQAASGQLVGNSWNFGTLQVGQQVSQNLVVKNTASTGAYSEDLNVSFGAAGNSQISGSGSLSGIQAGQTSTGANGTMTVTVTGLTAGALSSGIAVNYESAGKVGGVDNGLGTLAVGSENFAVNGTINAVANVVNQASPAWGSTSVNLGAVRVGAASPTASLALTNQATAAPQAALNASIASNGAPVTASGSVSLLAPGASSNALTVGLNTAVAGNYTGGNAGSATVQLVSDASNVGGCAPNCQMTLAPQVISVSGKVYNPAVGQLDTPVLDFGIVRVGDTVSAKNIIVKNMATASALDDTLHASVSGLSGPFTDGGPAAGITAGSSGQITVNLGTAAAGVYSQSGNVQFLSQNADMADVSAGADASVLIQAQINNLANADFDLLSGLGALTDDGNGNYLLDLGNIALGSSGNWMLQLDNDVSGPADWLLGAFDLTGVSDFTSSGWNNLGAGGLAAGQAQGGLSLGFVASALGAVQDQIVFNGWSHNGYGADLAQTRTLTVRANVYDPGNNVPEPGTLALVALGALLARRRCSRGGAGGHA